MKTPLFLSLIVGSLLACGCQSGNTRVVTADGSTVKTETSADGSTVKVETTDADGNKQIAEISGDENSSTIKDGKGNETTMGNAVSDAELDLPKYPGAALVKENSMILKSENGRTMSFMYKTPDAFAKVHEFYKAELSKVKPTEFSSGGDESAFFGIEEGKRSALISVTRKGTEKETLIAISVTDKK